MWNYLELQLSIDACALHMEYATLQCDWQWIRQPNDHVNFLVDLRVALQFNFYVRLSNSKIVLSIIIIIGFYHFGNAWNIERRLVEQFFEVIVESNFHFDDLYWFRWDVLIKIDGFYLIAIVSGVMDGINEESAIDTVRGIERSIFYLKHDWKPFTDDYIVE